MFVSVLKGVLGVVVGMVFILVSDGLVFGRVLRTVYDVVSVVGCFWRRVQWMMGAVMIWDVLAMGYWR